MAWLKVEGALPQHRKIMDAALRLGPGHVARVLGIWMLGACHAVAHLTDGFVPTFILENPTYDRKVKAITAALVAAGLIRVVEGGYQYHDFTHYNPGADVILAKRKADLARKFQNDSAKNRVGIAPESEKFPLEVSALAGAAGRACPNPYPNPNPKPNPLRGKTPKPPRAWPADFLVFWQQYPKKVGKEKALGEWLKLQPTEALRMQMQQTLDWQARTEEWQKKRGQFIPHASSWLHNHRWEDEPFHPEPDRVEDVLGANDAVWAELQARGKVS